MKHSSEILQGILDSPENTKLTVGEFSNLFGTRSLALVILIFALPHAIPIIEPPGVSTVTGIPILFFALQVIIGGNKIWIPKKIAEKKMPQQFLRKSIKFTLPAIKFIEKFIKPRWKKVFSKNGQRIIGCMIFMMALILAFPIPGGNFLPGLAICLLSLALLETDGILATIAIVFSVLSVYVMYNLIVFAIKSVVSWVSGLF